jgi:hypothetical protein
MPISIIQDQFDVIHGVGSLPVTFKLPVQQGPQQRPRLVGRSSALTTSTSQAGRIMDDRPGIVNHPELWPFSPFTGRDL